MTLTSAVLCVLVLGAGGDEVGAGRGAEPAVLTLTPTATPADAVRFDELPPPPKVADDQRLKRFLGALAGGVVGFGATMAMMPLADGGCFGFTAGCTTAGHAVAGMLSPVLTMVGAWAGFQLLGGDGGVLTPVAALLPAALLGMLLMNVARDAGAQTGVQLLPYVVATGLVLAGGSAIALDQRARTLDALGAASEWGRANPGRVALASLVSVLTLGGGAFLTALVGSVCRDAACLPLPIVVGAVMTGASAAATWGVHRGLDGRGTYGATLLGLVIGSAFSFGLAALFGASQSGFTFNPVRNTGSTLVLAEAIGFAALFAAPLALELSHTAAVEGSLPKVSLSAGPTRGGGMVGASMRF